MSSRLENLSALSIPKNGAHNKVICMSSDMHSDMHACSFSSIPNTKAGLL